MGVADEVTPEIMLAFYRRLYPFQSIFSWLNHEHNPTRLFTHREFAFTLKGDVYLRYNSFTNAEELKKQVCNLNPTRFEIGPVYSSRPRDKKTLRAGALTPMLRELVFDIDMTDYDPVRTCCSGADICRKCWKFITAAVKVLDKSIRNEFGYERLLWVYSGRRGIHLWISDREAMELTDGQRKALVGWLTVVQPGKDNVKKLNIHNSGLLPPSLQNALDDLRHIFPDIILHDQNLFKSESAYEEMLKLMPDNKVADIFRKEWEDHPKKNSEEKWEDVLEYKEEIKKNKADHAKLEQAIHKIILQYTYPRLDAEVSKHRNHLLKAPFCVHPKTGRVCVPVDPGTMEDFDPEKVPTVAQLLNELDAIDNPEDSRADWEKTSLKPYIDLLNQHALSLMQGVRQEKLKSDMSW